MSSRFGLGIELDRILATVIFVVAAATAIDQGRVSHSGLVESVFILALALVYCASLYASEWWSLILFGLMSLPMAFAAYVLCDMGPTGPLKLLHKVHETQLWFWFTGYGIVRGLWAWAIALAQKDKMASPV